MKKDFKIFMQKFRLHKCVQRIVNFVESGRDF